MCIWWIERLTGVLRFLQTNMVFYFHKSCLIYFMSMPFGFFKKKLLFFCLYLLHIVLFNTNRSIFLCCLLLFASITALSVTVLPSLFGFAWSLWLPFIWTHLLYSPLHLQGLAQCPRYSRCSINTLGIISWVFVLRDKSERYKSIFYL